MWNFSPAELKMGHDWDNHRLKQFLNRDQSRHHESSGACCIIVCALCCIFLLSFVYFKGPSRDGHCKLAINAVFNAIYLCPYTNKH